MSGVVITITAVVQGSLVTVNIACITTIIFTNDLNISMGNKYVHGLVIIKNMRNEQMTKTLV